MICSSDFSRARQTAEIVRAHLGVPRVVIAEALRERCFGDWEGTPTANYARVWAADEASAGRGFDNHVEPATAVLDRVTAFIVELERQYSGRDILLVSHGDTLQILQAGFLRIDPSRHGACRTRDGGDPPVAPRGSPSLTAAGVDNAEEVALRIGQDNEVSVIGVGPVDPGTPEGYQSLDLGLLFQGAVGVQVEMRPSSSSRAIAMAASDRGNRTGVASSL